MLGQFITGFAARSFVVALPTISTALDADILAISWALIAYQIGNVSLSVVFGRLGDLHGRDAIYGGGFVVMAVSALACGVAPTAAWLIVFRLTEGIGASMLASATRVLALDAMPENAAGRANGFMTMSFHGGVLMGPAIGGFVVDALSWRWIFFLLVPIGAVGVVLTAMRRGERRPARSGERVTIDYAGAVLLVVLTIVLVLLLDRRSAELVGLGGRGVMTAAFVAALVAFGVHERRAPQPLVNFALFRIRLFVFSVVSLLMIAIGNSALMLLLPFYMQDVLGQSASFMGLVFLSAPVFTIVLAPVVGRLTDQIGARIPASIGVLMTMTAFVAGMWLRADSHWLLPAVVMAFTGLGQGFFNTSNQTALLGSVPREYRGFATGLVGMVFALGGLLGTALGSALLAVMFRYASRRSDATPSAADPASFVFAVNGTAAVCVAIAVVALAASLMRGPSRGATRAPSSPAG